MSVAIAIFLAMTGLGIGLAIQSVRRQAAAIRNRCPWDRPQPERIRRLRQALQGYGQWIDTEEVGIPPQVVDEVCVSAGWRVQAAFRIDDRAWMLWVVPPTPPPPVATGPAPRPWHRRLARSLLLAATVLTVGLAFILALANSDRLPTVPVLAVGALLGVGAAVLLVRCDPLQRPRRLLWADLTAQFDAEWVRIHVGPLSLRYRRLVTELAASLGYRPAWGGSKGVLAFRRVRPEEARGTGDHRP